MTGKHISFYKKQFNLNSHIFIIVWVQGARRVKRNKQKLKCTLKSLLQCGIFKSKHNPVIIYHLLYSQQLFHHLVTFHANI